MHAPLPRICFVAPNAFPLLAGDQRTELIGGAEVQQVIVAKGLAARGYEVCMICLDFGQEQEVQIAGVKVLRAYNWKKGVPIVRFLSPRLTGIWRALAQADADVYYQRAAGMLTGVVVAFCRRNRRKSIFAAAGNPDLERNTPRIRYARDRIIYEYGLRHVDLIAVQNDEQASLCRGNFGRNSTLIPNCYPLPKHVRAGGGRHVLWVSTIRALKRPELFLDLAAALPDYQFRMIGGPGQREASLFNATKLRAGPIPNLHFKGFMPYSKVEKEFDDASLLVNTSESEGFPNTFLQAWARGVPTVSFVDCGARAHGLPVGLQVGTTGELISCVKRLLNEESERIGVGKLCRQYYLANHSPESVLNLYERTFGELVAESP